MEKHLPPLRKQDQHQNKDLPTIFLLSLKTTKACMPFLTTKSCTLLPPKGNCFIPRSSAEVVRDHSVSKNPLPNARAQWKIWLCNDISYFSHSSDRRAERSHWGERGLVWTPGLRRHCLLRWGRHSCTRNRRQLTHKHGGYNPQGSPLRDPSYSEIPYPAGVSDLLTLPLKIAICKTATQVML